MNQLPQLSHDMFLDDNIQEVVAHVRRVHATYLNFARLLNRTATQALLSAKVSTQDLQQVLLAGLELRALTTFQSIVILAEHGLESECRVLLRTLLEVMFRAVAIAKDRGVADLYVLEDECHRNKYINKYKALSPDFKDPGRLQQLGEIQDELAAKIKNEAIGELGTQWFANKAGLLDYYHSAYL